MSNVYFPSVNVGARQRQIIISELRSLVAEWHYHINVFWYPDDKCWIADVPDLKPCSAHGATPSEAVAEAEVAIDLWLETATEHGLPIPEPRYRAPTYAAA